ncbi:trypsin-like peptidase domain-containing protein [bacterium]|nr:trypsin-like peptidase domain-containing protein [bacterium]
MKIIELLKNTSARIYIKNALVGSGTLFKIDDRAYVITAAHVIYGKDYGQHPSESSIIIKDHDGDEYNCEDIFTLPDFDQKDIDIALIRIDSDSSWVNKIIFNEPYYELDAKCFFRGYPKIKQGKGQNIIDCTITDNYNYNYKFELKGSTEEFIQKIEGSGSNFEGISGSGIFQHINGYPCLIGIVTGFSNKNGEFCTYDCININKILEFPDIKKEELLVLEDKQKSDLKSKLIAEYDRNTSQLVAKDIHDDKSYYPPLFEPHPRLEKSFNSFMKSQVKAFSVIASSGMGKTCWMCYKAKQLLDQGQFVYLKRFGNVKTGIYDDIIERLKDLPFFENTKSTHDGIEKLSEIIGDSILYIFIDGLDEKSTANKNIILNDAIDNIQPNLRLIVSCKSMYWNNYIYDNGEPSKLCSNLFIEKIDEKNDRFSFEIRDLLDSQLDKIINNYRIEYSYTKVISRELLNEFKKNTYLLHIAFSIFREDKDFILELSSKAIIDKYIQNIRKKYNISQNDMNSLLEIAKQIFEENSDRINYVEVPENLLKSNIIVVTKSDEFDAKLEFYYSKLRDYIIALKILELDTKGTSYFEKYRENLTNVRLEVLNTYYAICDNSIKEKISPQAYQKATEFINSRNSLVSEKYSNIRSAISPYSENDAGLLVHVDLKDDVCRSHSFFSAVDISENIVMYPFNVKNDYFFEAVDRFNINSMSFGYDLNESSHEKEIEKEIIQTIELNIHGQYHHSFNISRNPLLLNERVLILTITNYKYILNIENKQYRPCGNYLPINLDTIKYAVYHKCYIFSLFGGIKEPEKFTQYEIQRMINQDNYRSILEKEGIKPELFNKETTTLNNDLQKFLTPYDLLLLKYINELNKLEIFDLLPPLFNDWSSNVQSRMNASFRNYEKDDIPKLVEKKYEILLREYRLFIENNFPKIKDMFKHYKQTQYNHTIIIDKSSNQICKFGEKSDKLSVKAEYGIFKGGLPEVYKEEPFSVKNYYSKYQIGDTFCSMYIDRLFESGLALLGESIPDDFDLLNRTILTFLKEDFENYIKDVKQLENDSFSFDISSLPKDLFETFESLCKDILSSNNSMLRIDDDKYDNNHLLKLIELKILEDKFTSNSGIVKGVRIRHNCIYQYLIKFYSNFSEIFLRTKQKLLSLQKNKIFNSNELSKQIDVDKILFDIIRCELKRTKKIRMIELNGDMFRLQD